LLSVNDVTKRKTNNASPIMKTLFMAEAIFKSAPSETSQTSNRLQPVIGGNFRGGSPSATGCVWPIQSGRIPARGQQASVLMGSQLG
jgi:hypothetical protein